MEVIQYNGFTPDETLRQRADRALDRILEQAPDDASVSISLEKNGDSFHCEVNVESCFPSINVEASHRLAALALDRAEVVVRRRLGRWTKAKQVEALPARAPLRASSSLRG